MHQAAFHGRPKVVEVLIELCTEADLLKEVLTLKSNPCGRGVSGFPLELAHDKQCAALLENVCTKE